jgi:hypothetical protein
MASISAGQQVVASATNGSAANALLLYDTATEGPSRGVYIICITGNVMVGVDPIHKGPSHEDTPDDLDYLELPLSASVTLRWDESTRARIYGYAMSGTGVLWMGVVEG